MAPVRSHGADALVGHADQLIATVLTSTVAVAAVLATIALCRRQRIRWPLLVLVSGGATFLLEPLFDHLYGLWFFTHGQWNAVVTYGIHVPIWLPIVYVPYYGAWTVFLIRRFARGATAGDIAKLFVASVSLATLAEQLYIQAFHLYDYQAGQPFYVAHYPVFVAVVNGVPPFLAAIVYVRLVPLLRGVSQLAHLAVVPVCFCADSFGSGFLYLAARHSGSHPPMALLSILALVTVATAVGMVFAAAKLAGLDQLGAATSAEREQPRSIATGAPGRRPAVELLAK
jgi:hypothetical protein